MIRAELSDKAFKLDDFADGDQHGYFCSPAIVRDEFNYLIDDKFYNTPYTLFIYYLTYWLVVADPVDR
jgi:hypothetical protein